ncbi:MAG: deaminase [bacterium]
MKRLRKNERYLAVALVMAKCGSCLRRNYGAVIVKDDRIISTGYTGSPRGEENCCDIGTCYRIENQIPQGKEYESCRSCHAEANAIIFGNPTDMKDATLYLAGIDYNTSKELVGVKPCSICMRMIKNAGVCRVVTTDGEAYNRITEANKMLNENFYNSEENLQYEFFK